MHTTGRHYVEFTKKKEKKKPYMERQLLQALHITCGAKSFKREIKITETKDERNACLYDSCC